MFLSDSFFKSCGTSCALFFGEEKWKMKKNMFFNVSFGLFSFISLWFTGGSVQHFEIIKKLIIWVEVSFFCSPLCKSIGSVFLLKLVFVVTTQDEAEGLPLCEVQKASTCQVSLQPNTIKYPNMCVCVYGGFWSGSPLHWASGMGLSWGTDSDHFGGFWPHQACSPR